MAAQSIKRDVNDSSTWAYPDIPSGVTVIRKENVTEDEIFEIYKECIYIQRDAYIRMVKQQVGGKSHPQSQLKEITANSAY